MRVAQVLAVILATEREAVLRAIDGPPRAGKQSESRQYAPLPASAGRSPFPVWSRIVESHEPT
jgi:hypothetical protein